MPATTPRNQIASAIGAVLSSPNESDSNGETANVVDGLFAIARSIDGVSAAIDDAVAHGLSVSVQLEDPNRNDGTLPLRF